MSTRLWLIVTIIPLALIVGFFALLEALSGIGLSDIVQLLGRLVG